MKRRSLLALLGLAPVAASVPEIASATAPEKLATIEPQAVTAAYRMMLDNSMFASLPGGLISTSAPVVPFEDWKATWDRFYESRMHAYEGSQ